MQQLYFIGEFHYLVFLKKPLVILTNKNENFMAGKWNCYQKTDRQTGKTGIVNGIFYNKKTNNFADIILSKTFFKQRSKFPLDWS